MSEKDKLDVLKSQLGTEKFNDILDILIKTNSEYDFEIIKIIKNEILNKFSISEKQLIKATSNDIKRIKAIYVYFISQYTNAKSKEIALFTELETRSYFRYKQTAREFLLAKNNTIFYKINAEFIDKVKELRKTIIIKIQNINNHE